MTLNERFFSKVEMDPNGGCWLWSGSQNGDGYGKFRHAHGVVAAHRASYEFFKGQINGLYVLHKCDVRACVNPDHVAAGTQSTNIQDMIAKGRGGHLRGETNPGAKLTENAVRDIRARCEGRGMIQSLAKEYGVSPSCVSEIKNLKRWAHLQ